MSNIKVKITEGLLIALFPILGYIAAYCFEMNYLSFYGIGEEFVNISLNYVIVSVVLILLIFCLVIALAELCYPLIIQFKSDNPIHRRILASSVFLVLSLLLFTISNSVFLPLSLLSITLLAIITSFVKPAVLYRKESISYIEKLKKSDSIQKSKTQSETRGFLKGILLNTNLRPATYIVTIALCVIVVSGFMGTFFASTKTDYLVYTNNSDSFIIIRSNNGEKIAVGVDLNKKSIINKFLIINSSKDLELIHSHTGRLSNVGVSGTLPRQLPLPF